MPLDLYFLHRIAASLKEIEEFDIIGRDLPPGGPVPLFEELETGKDPLRGLAAARFEAALCVADIVQHKDAAKRAENDAANLSDNRKALPRGSPGADHYVKALFIPWEKFAQLVNGRRLVHIGEKDDLALGSLDACPDRRRFAPVGNIEQREVGRVLDKILDQASAIVCGLVVDDDDFPRVILPGDVLMHLVQHASFEVPFFVVTGNNDRVIVPDTWNEVDRMADLTRVQARLGRPLRVATKFPNAATPFFTQKGLTDVNFIAAEGTLEIAPTIGYADLITDLVSTGTTLRDNHLKRLEDGEILSSQACLIANRTILRENPRALAIARTLLEYIAAHLRARVAVSVFVNMRGDSPESIARSMFAQEVIGGLQGPTFSPVITRQGERWYAAHLVVSKDQLAQAIAELRSIGGSGVVVAPVTYIFEEEPAEYRAMLEALS